MKQVADRDRLAEVVKLGHVFADVVVQRDLAVLGQEVDCERRELFGHRGDMKDGGRGDGASCSISARPKPCVMSGLPPRTASSAHPGESGFAHWAKTFCASSPLRRRCRNGRFFRRCALRERACRREGHERGDGRTGHPQHDIPLATPCWSALLFDLAAGNPLSRFPAALKHSCRQKYYRAQQAEDFPPRRSRGCGRESRSTRQSATAGGRAARAASTARKG